jgi:phosphoribosylanthranilate isomerase
MNVRLMKLLLISEQVDALLLDSGNPNLTVKLLGGTGPYSQLAAQQADRRTIARACISCGWIEPGKCEEAIDTVQPFGLDLCSSVRTDQTHGAKLDPAKLDAFF